MPLSPPVHAYMMKARRESEEIISTLSGCQTKQELIAGFAKAAAIVTSGTGNEQLAATCRMIASSGSEFSSEQIEVLRDDIVKNARAFIASTNSAVG